MDVSAGIAPVSAGFGRFQRNASRRLRLVRVFASAATKAMRQLNLCLARAAFGAKQPHVAFIDFRATIAPLYHVIADQSHWLVIERVRRAASLASSTAFCDQPHDKAAPYF
jgi:hypothetical protein